MEYTKAIVDCMTELRRELRSELSVDIRMSQDNAVQSMLAACEQSSRQQTQDLALKLSQLSGILPKRAPLTEAELIEQYTRYQGPLRG